jgi:hypothetical protein
VVKTPKPAFGIVERAKYTPHELSFFSHELSFFSSILAEICSQRRRTNNNRDHNLTIILDDTVSVKKVS